MNELLIGTIIIVVVVYLVSAKLKDRRNRGCRDCEACLRPLVWRIGVAMTWGLIRAPFVAFQSCCPHCCHVVRLHQFREDGAYID